MVKFYSIKAKLVKFSSKKAKMVKSKHLTLQHETGKILL